MELLAVPVSFGLKNLLLTLVPSNLPRLSEIALNGRALSVRVPGCAVYRSTVRTCAGVTNVESATDGQAQPGIARRGHRLAPESLSQRLWWFASSRFSLVLMVGAGLLLRSFWKVLEVQPGFNSEHIVTAQLWLPVPNDPKNNPYPTQEKRNIFLTEVLRRLSALPGVSDVAIGGAILLSPDCITPTASISRAECGIGRSAHRGVGRDDPELFHVLGMPLVRGRVFTDDDDEKGERVVVIDETAAERFWPNEDPVGKQIKLQFGQKPPWRRVVGVVGRSRADGLDAPYTPHLLSSRASASD